MSWSALCLCCQVDHHGAGGKHLFVSLVVNDIYENISLLKNYMSELCLLCLLIFIFKSHLTFRKWKSVYN